MKFNDFSRAMAYLVIFVSSLVIFGWIFDIALLKSILPSWVTMKFSTAVSFIASGFLLLFFVLKRKANRDSQHFYIPVFSLFLLTLMSTLLVSSSLGVASGIENLLFREFSSAVLTVSPGLPSVGTAICFVLIGLLGLLEITRERRKLGTLLVGGIVFTIGVVAVVGYILQNPSLYYYFSGISTAMALHTAILFVCLGLGIVTLDRGAESEA